MKLFWLICIFLFVFFTNNAQILSADQLFLEGRYDLAAVGYEELFYKEVHSDSRIYYLLGKAECYKRLGQYEKAYRTLTRVNLPENDSLLLNVLKQKIVLSFLSENFQETYQHLLRCKLQGIVQDQELIFYEFLTLVSLNRWEEAKEFLYGQKEILGLSDDEIEPVFPKKMKFKNPEKAHTISVFLPGVGQAYAGYPLKGVLSGAIQTGLVGFSIYSMYYGYFFSGALPGVGLFYSFYLGGANYAETLAIRHNQMTGQTIQFQFIELIETKKALN